MGLSFLSLEWGVEILFFLEGHSEAPEKRAFYFSFDFRGVTRKLFLGILEGKSFGITNSGQVGIFERGKLRIVPIWRNFLVIFLSKNHCFWAFLEPKTLDRSGLEVDF